MKVRRIVANVATQNVAAAEGFYRDVLGLDRLMDHSWIVTYGSDEQMRVQIGFASQGGSGTPVPDLSIEVDDLGAALDEVRRAGIPIEYGPAVEPWGVRRFYIRDPLWQTGQHPGPPAAMRSADGPASQRRFIFSEAPPPGPPTGSPGDPSARRDLHYGWR